MIKVHDNNNTFNVSLPSKGWVCFMLAWSQVMSSAPIPALLDPATVLCRLHSGKSSSKEHQQIWSRSMHGQLSQVSCCNVLTACTPFTEP